MAIALFPLLVLVVPVTIPMRRMYWELRWMWISLFSKSMSFHSSPASSPSRMTDYFEQIRNRIFYEGEQNKEIFQHVLIAAHNIKDVNLSVNGLLLLRDLLAGYFPLKDIIDLHGYFDDKNKRGEIEFNYKKLLRAQPKQSLRDMFEEIMKEEVPLEQVKDKDFRLSAIRDEIARKSTLLYLLHG